MAGRKPIIAPYLRLNKKISNPMMLAQIQIFCKEWGMDGTDVCYKVLYDTLKKEADKRNTFKENLISGR